MTDIIFKANITQPASNVANLNFVDNVITFNAKSIVKIDAECGFASFSVTAIISKIELKPASSFTELVPLDVFTSRQSKGIVPAIGFHIVNQGDGDPYFENVKLLSHFDRTTGNGEFYDEKNRKCGLSCNFRYPKNFTDAEKWITYIPDSDSFDGNVVSSEITSDILFFGDIIEPANASLTILTAGEGRLLGIRGSFEKWFKNDGSYLVKTVNIDGKIKTYQEWFDIYAAIDEKTKNYILVNGVEMNVADYKGDYGKNLSIRGKDWCLESRFKITSKEASGDLSGKIVQPFSLSTREFSISAKIRYKGDFDAGVIYGTDFIEIEFRPYSEKFIYFTWRVLNPVDEVFSSIKLCCTNGNYNLYFDGAKIDVSSSSYDTVLPNSWGNLCRNELFNTPPSNFIEIQLEIRYSPIFPVYQLYGIPVDYKSFKIRNESLSEQEVADLINSVNFIKINSTKTCSVYATKTPLPSKWDVEVNSFSIGIGTDVRKIPNYAKNYALESGVTKLVFSTNFVDIFFDTQIVVQSSVRFYFPRPLVSEFYFDDIALIKLAETNFSTKNEIGFKNNIFVESYVHIESGFILFSYYVSGSGEYTTISKQSISYIDGTIKKSSAILPQIEYVNDSTSFEVDISKCCCWNPQYDPIGRNRYKLRKTYQIGEKTKLECYKVIVESNGKYDVYPIIDLNPNSSDEQENQDLFNKDFLTLLKKEIPIINYTYRQEIIDYEYVPNDDFFIRKFNLGEDYFEIVFDGETFVEPSVRFDLPFKPQFLYSALKMQWIRNFDISISIVGNNRFVIKINQYEITEDSFSPLESYQFEFIATVKNWDTKIYDANYRDPYYSETNTNYIKLEARYLDEFRFTIGNSRINESATLLEPFPNFVENRITFEAQFDLSAVFKFGSNNFIKLEPKATLKGFIKKPKITTSPSTTLGMSEMSLIEFTSGVLIGKENVFEVSIVCASSFALVLPPEPRACDPLFEKVVLLMPCDASPVIDIKGHQVTTGSTFEYSELQSKWATGSAKFNGTTSSVLTVPHDDIFRLRNDSIFCIEFWFYADEVKFGGAINRKMLLSFANTGAGINWNIMLSSYGFVYLSTDQNMDTYSNATSSNIANLKNWNYVRITNNSITLNDITRIFKINLGAASAATTGSYTLQIGGITRAGANAYCLNGYISDIRITIGDNRAGDKLPPTAKFPIISCIGLDTTPAPPPTITPIRLSKTTTIEPLASFSLTNYPAIHVKYDTDIAIETGILFELINPIMLEQQSEINIFIDLALKQIKTELVYLAAENRSKASTGFVDKLLDGNSVASIFDGGTIEFYTGNRPYSANHGVTGTLLGELKNIKFGVPINRIIRKDESQTWLLTAISSGQIGWFRIKADVASDYGQDSIREVRLDGEAGVDVIAIDFAVKAGEYYHIQDFAVMWGNG